MTQTKRESATMVTRRTVMGTGLAFSSMALASMTGLAGFRAFDPLDRRKETSSIDALLIDETIEMPAEMAALIEDCRRTLRVVGVRLDAAAHAGLRRMLDDSHALAGLSSGATLFCLERIAWDHGLRLTARSERCAVDAGDHSWRRALAEFVDRVHPSAASLSPLARAYRPTRGDGLLHAWRMQKSASPQFRSGPREAR